jgi:phosphatidylglycerol:prolipoprotein diacylglycerol transferase
MLPIFNLGPWQVSTYTAVNALAILVAGMVAFHRLVRGLDQPPQVVVRGATLIILAGLLGRYLVRAVLVVQDLVRGGDLHWAGGNSFVGALAGGSLAWLLYCRRHHIPLGQAFDLGLAAPLPLGQAIGRLGCLAAGCCFGKPTDSWLGVYLPDHAGLWAMRYPTQLLAAAANLLIFFTLLAMERYRRRRSPPHPNPLPQGERGLSPLPWGRGRGRGKTPPFDSFLFLLYLGLYCLKRFVLEFLRGDALPVLGPVSWVHLYTVAIMVVVTALIASNTSSVLHRKGG